MGTIRDKKLKNEEQRLIVSQDNKLITEKTYEEKQEIMSKWGIKFDDILLLEDGERPKFETVEEPKTKWFE